MGKRSKSELPAEKFLSLPKKDISKHGKTRRCSKAVNKKVWKGVTCPVCLEFPHNAVLLLCSSYHKGCRPFMCATSSRFSNCLDQYKNAYTNEEKMETPQLMCPLCRGQVKGWTVVEDARKCLNSKKRSCMQDKCSFVGSYRQLRKHVKAKHPRARPREVDPVLEEKWKKLEVERERGDVITTIMSSTPGAMVLGDYVIEPYNGRYEEEEDDGFDSEDLLQDDFFDMGMLRGRTGGFLDLGMRRAPLSRFSGPASVRALRRMLLPRSRWARASRGNRS